MDVGYIDKHTHTYMYIYVCVYIYFYICVYIYIFIDIFNIRLFRSCIHIRFLKIPFNCNVILIYIFKPSEKFCTCFEFGFDPRPTDFCMWQLELSKYEEETIAESFPRQQCQECSEALLLKVWSLDQQLPGSVLEMQRPTESESASSALINVDSKVWEPLL